MEETGRVSGATEGSASEAADAATWRLAQAPTRGAITLGEDGAAALEVETYRPQTRARSPREPRVNCLPERPRSEVVF